MKYRGDKTVIVKNVTLGGLKSLESAHGHVII